MVVSIGWLNIKYIQPYFHNFSLMSLSTSDWTTTHTLFIYLCFAAFCDQMTSVLQPNLPSIVHATTTVSQFDPISNRSNSKTIPPIRFNVKSTTSPQPPTSVRTTTESPAKHPNLTDKSNGSTKWNNSSRIPVLCRIIFITVIGFLHQKFYWIILSKCVYLYKLKFFFSTWLEWRHQRSADGHVG